VFQGLVLWLQEALSSVITFIAIILA
jgi:hypothetical protein